MGHSLSPLVVLLLVVVAFSSLAFAQNCPTSYQNRVFASCNSLTQLNAALSWTYKPSTGSVDIAFRATPAATGGWVGWGINPTGGAAMVGTQALIAFKHSNGTYIVDTYDVKSKTPPLQPSSISISVTSKNVEEENGQIIIFASLVLPSNKTTVNHVWQVGSNVNGLIPGIHATASANLQSAGSINLKTGISTGSSIPNKRLKDRHGVLNVVGWGILMPIGAIIARYLKTFESADPAWFYMHALCQSSGYILGVAGWATGLKLGSDSKGVKYSTHRNIGITLFCFGTLQVFALLLRPKKDHKFRIYWNVYHHSVGYAVIVLSIVNIFKGFDILKPEDKWKHAYIGVIASLGGIAVILEIITWIIFFRRKSQNSSKSFNGISANGGANGYGLRQSHAV